MDFQVKVDQEAKDLLRDLIKAIKDFNGHLKTIEEMIAPYVGWNVVPDKKE